MSDLIIFSKYRAKADSLNVVKTALENLVLLSRKTAGCLKYDLHQDKNDPHYFLFHEIWTSHALRQRNRDSPEVTKRLAAIEDDIEESSFFEMAKLNPPTNF